MNEEEDVGWVANFEVNESDKEAEIDQVSQEINRELTQTKVAVETTIVKQETNDALVGLKNNENLEWIELSSTLSFLEKSPFFGALEAQYGAEKAEKMINSLDMLWNNLFVAYGWDKVFDMKTKEIVIRSFNVALLKWLEGEWEAWDGNSLVWKFTKMMSFGESNKAEAGWEGKFDMMWMLWGFLSNSNKFPGFKSSSRKMLDLINEMKRKNPESEVRTQNGSDKFFCSQDTEKLLGYFLWEDVKLDEIVRKETTNDQKLGPLEDMAEKLDITDEKSLKILEDFTKVETMAAAIWEEELASQASWMYWMMEWISRMFGYDSPKALLEDWGLAGIAGLFFGWMWVEWGLDWLHQKYTMDALMEDIPDGPKKKAIASAHELLSAMSPSELAEFNKEDANYVAVLKKIKNIETSVMYDKIPKNAAAMSDLLLKSIEGTATEPWALPHISLLEKYAKQCVTYEKVEVEWEKKKKKVPVIDASKFNATDFVNKMWAKPFLDMVADIETKGQAVKIWSTTDLATLYVGSVMSPRFVAAYMDGTMNVEEFIQPQAVVARVDAAPVVDASSETTTTEKEAWSTDVADETNSSNQENVQFEDSPLEELYTGHNPLESSLLHTAIDWELKNAPFKFTEVLASSRKFNVPIEYLMAFMKNDSSYGSKGKALRTLNPGNVWNTGKWGDQNSIKWKTWKRWEDYIDYDGTRIFDSWEAWVGAVWKNLQRRIKEYREVYPHRYPTPKELADNIWPDGKGFLRNYNRWKLNSERKWAYMEAVVWPKAVNTYAFDLIKKWISNRQEFFKAVDSEQESTHEVISRSFEKIDNPWFETITSSNIWKIWWGPWNLRWNFPQLSALPILKNRYGIKTIVSLSDIKNTSPQFKSKAEELWLKVVHIPLWRERPSVADFNKIKEIYKQWHCFIHCQHGADRTGAVVWRLRKEVDGRNDAEVNEELHAYNAKIKPWSKDIQSIENFAGFRKWLDQGVVNTWIESSNEKIENSDTLIASKTSEILPFWDSWTVWMSNVNSSEWIKNANYMHWGDQTEKILLRLQDNIWSLPRNVKSLLFMNNMNDSFRTPELANKRLETMKKIIDLCLSHGIQPIVSLLPHPRWTQDDIHFGQHDYFEQYQMDLVNYANGKVIWWKSIPIFDIRDTDMWWPNWYHPSNYNKLLQKLVSQFWLNSEVA